MQVITPPCKYNQTKQLRLPVAIVEWIAFCEETNTLSRPIPGQIVVVTYSIQADLQHPAGGSVLFAVKLINHGWTYPFNPASFRRVLLRNR